MWTLFSWIRDLRSVVSPRFCAICGRHLSLAEDSLCGECLVGLPFLEINDLYDNPTTRLFWGKVRVERGHSFVRYKAGAKSQRIVSKLKNGHRPDLGVYMGRMMARDLLPCGFFEGIDAIVPLPLHWRRMLERGYNQSSFLARGVADETGLPVIEDCVARVRNNDHQTRKTATERLKNTEGLFCVKGEMPYSHVLLVDDVLTTSATLSSFARAIQEVHPQMRFSILTWAKA